MTTKTIKLITELAEKNPAKRAVETLKSKGYDQAKAGDSITDIARWCIGNVVGFPVKADIPSESKDQLYQGYRLRRNEWFKPTMSILDSGREQLVTVDVAYSFTSVSFGKLKNDQPKLYHAVKDVRIATDSYCSKNYNRLLAKGLEIQNEGKERGKRTTLSFEEQVAKSFDSLDGKARLMASKEIENKVVEDRYKRAVVAFNRVWNSED
jgi:hypothetical protein